MWELVGRGRIGFNSHDYCLVFIYIDSSDALLIVTVAVETKFFEEREEQSNTNANEMGSYCPL